MDVFQALGSLPVVTERFNNLVSTGAILTVVDFNILADILSGPFALLVSSAQGRSKANGPDNISAKMLKSTAVSDAVWYRRSSCVF